MTRPVRGRAALAAALVMGAAAPVAVGASCGQAGAGFGGAGSGGATSGEPAVALPPAAAGPIAPAPVEAAPGDDEGPVSWLKGSTHVHTIHSGDSSTTVDDVVRWYREHGYDFIVITDHNRVTEHEAVGPPLVLRGIELTHNPASCDPPPFEPDGRCRIHLNGLGLAKPTPIAVTAAASADTLAPGARPPAIEWKNQATASRLEMYQAGIDKVRQLGGIVQLNHPNWHWGVDPGLLAELGRRGAVLVEVANMGFARWNTGNGLHASSESLWDAALSQGVLLYGVASDDAHDYDEAEIERKRAAGSPVYRAGTGWVMVRAARRADSIRRALARGDFYSSSGVTLERLEMVDGGIQIDVAGASPGAHQIDFIGQGGVVLERVSARSARFALDWAPAGYVRAVVTRDDGARAWTQPVRVPLDRTP